LERLAEVDLIFADPDNGVCGDPKVSRREKYAFMSELSDYSTRGQSIIVYQHANRQPGGVASQVQTCLRTLSAGTGFTPLGAVVGRRGSCRFLLIVPVPQHRQRLADVLANYDATWRPHAEFVQFA
jgi:hypothetical protein